MFKFTRAFILCQEKGLVPSIRGQEGSKVFFNNSLLSNRFFFINYRSKNVHHTAIYLFSILYYNIQENKIQATPHSSNYGLVICLIPIHVNCIMFFHSNFDFHYVKNPGFVKVVIKNSISPFIHFNILLIF